MGSIGGEDGGRSDKRERESVEPGNSLTYLLFLSVYLVCLRHRLGLLFRVYVRKIVSSFALRVLFGLLFVELVLSFPPFPAIAKSIIPHCLVGGTGTGTGLAGCTVTSFEFQLPSSLISHVS
jgi:hypothetical protein